MSNSLSERQGSTGDDGRVPGVVVSDILPRDRKQVSRGMEGRIAGRPGRSGHALSARHQQCEVDLFVIENIAKIVDNEESVDPERGRGTDEWQQRTRCALRA